MLFVLLFRRCGLSKHYFCPFQIIIICHRQLQEKLEKRFFPLQPQFGFVHFSVEGFTGRQDQRVISVMSAESEAYTGNRTGHFFECLRVDRFF